MFATSDQALEAFFLVLAALLPAVFLMVGTWLRDTHEPEPKLIVTATVIIGLALPLVCYWPEMLISELISFFRLSSITTGVLNAFFVAGLVEELAKFAVFMALIYRNENFNEPFDGIIYSVAISLGFAGFENILYVLLSWLASDAPSAWSVVQSRSLMAVPQHALCGMFMGYYLGRARFTERPHERHQLIALAFVVPFLLHGLYDALLEVFGDRGILPCLGLLGVQYLFVRRLTSRLLAMSPFISASKARLAGHLHHSRRDEGPHIPRSRWPWER